MLPVILFHHDTDPGNFYPTIHIPCRLRFDTCRGLTSKKNFLTRLKMQHGRLLLGNIDTSFRVEDMICKIAIDTINYT